MKNEAKLAKITVNCTVEQRKEIRIMAAQEDKSMNDFLLSLVEERKRQDKEHYKAS